MKRILFMLLIMGTGCQTKNKYFIVESKELSDYSFVGYKYKYKIGDINYHSGQEFNVGDTLVFVNKYTQ